MSFLKRWLRQLRGRRPAGGIRFELDEPSKRALRSLAKQQNQTPEVVAAGLIENALEDRRRAEVYLAIWRELSPREQEVAALTCLDYTNSQIALRLNISPETVKTHLRNLLNKFNLRTKAQLRQVLAGWDFTRWGEP